MTTQSSTPKRGNSIVLFEFLWIRRTCDYILLNAYCMLFSSRVRVRIRIRFSVCLISGYVHVFMLLSVVVVTLPFQRP